MICQRARPPTSGVDIELKINLFETNFRDKCYDKASIKMQIFFRKLVNKKSSNTLRQYPPNTSVHILKETHLHIKIKMLLNFCICFSTKALLLFPHYGFSNKYLFKRLEINQTITTISVVVYQTDLLIIKLKVKCTVTTRSINVITFHSSECYSPNYYRKFHDEYLIDNNF